ncbi:MAG: ECF-type sigma factor [Pirellula sp.]
MTLHFFSGFTQNEVAEVLDLSRATVYRCWAYARAFLKVALSDSRSKLS